MSARTGPTTSPFSDEDIRSVAERSPDAIAEWIRSIARERDITVQPGPHDEFIKAVSRLSDGVVDLDPVEELLVALGRAGVITAHQQGLLQVHYLR